MTIKRSGKEEGNKLKARKFNETKPLITDQEVTSPHTGDEKQEQST